MREALGLKLRSKTTPSVVELKTRSDAERSSREWIEKSATEMFTFEEKREPTARRITPHESTAPKTSTAPHQRNRREGV